MKTVQYTLPTFWACALVNGDETGLDDADQASLDAFVADMVKEHGSCHCLDVAEDEGFMRYHDAEPYGVLACDAATFTFAI
jgi:hypothetical protein